VWAASPDDELAKVVTATCPTWKVVIGWWYLAVNVSSSNEIVITQSYPLNSTTWEARGVVDGATPAWDESFALQAYAICANTN
jgi:hypothetical protein